MLNKLPPKEAFMAAVCEITEEVPQTSKRFLDGQTTIEILPEKKIYGQPIGDKEVYIDYLRVQELHKGHGTRAMQVITKLADEFGITLLADAVPNDKREEAADIEELINFYKKLGFREESSSTNLMYRNPKAP